jgi:hypothetical protein
MLRCTLFYHYDTGGVQVTDKVYDSTILECLRELADKSFQQRVWLASSGPEISSFTEATEGLFTDSVLGSELDKQRRVFSETIDAKFSVLHKKLLAIDSQRHPSKIIEDPRMEEVRALATELLDLLSKEGIS